MLHREGYTLLPHKILNWEICIQTEEQSNYMGKDEIKADVNDVVRGLWYEEGGSHQEERVTASENIKGIGLLLNNTLHLIAKTMLISNMKINKIRYKKIMIINKIK